MVLHEIGYLIIGGTFQCWFYGASSPCPNAEKVKPAGITREQASEFETREVDHEESGFAAFERKNDTLEIRKRTGEKIRIHLSELDRQTQDALPKTINADEIKNSLWRYQSIEEFFKGALLSSEVNFLPLLRKDDLKTPMIISKEQLERIRVGRIENLLKEQQWSLPIGKILTSVPCTYKQIDTNTMSGSCAEPGKAPAYVTPDRKSEKVLDTSLVWAHLAGRSIQDSKQNPTEHSEELFVFEEKGDWVRMKLMILNRSTRVVWLNKKDIPYKMVRLSPSDQVKTMIEFLNQSPITESNESRDLADDLKILFDQPLKLDLDSAGETKWSDGVLWVKVNVKGGPQCSDEESKIISTGWLPYMDPKTKKKILGWYSRGC